MLDLVLYVCAGSIVFVLGAMTGRAMEVWSQRDRDRLLREELTKMGQAVIGGDKKTRNGIPPS